MASPASTDSSSSSVTGLPGRRPAETTAAASAVALLIVKALGVDDPDILVALGIVIGFIPTVVTWLVITLRGKKSAPE